MVRHIIKLQFCNYCESATSLHTSFYFNLRVFVNITLRLSKHCPPWYSITRYICTDFSCKYRLKKNKKGEQFKQAKPDCRPRYVQETFILYNCSSQLQLFLSCIPTACFLHLYYFLLCLWFSWLGAHHSFLTTFRIDQVFLCTNIVYTRILRQLLWLPCLFTSPICSFLTIFMEATILTVPNY